MKSKTKYDNGVLKVKDPDNLKYDYDDLKDNVKESKAYKKFIRTKVGRKQTTNDNYLYQVSTYCYFFQETIEQLITRYKKNQKELTDDETEEDLEVFYDLTDFANHAVENKQAKTTIQNKTKRVTTFLRKNGVTVPNIDVNLRTYDDSEGYFTKKDLPDQETIKTVISESNPKYKAIFSFMYVSGSGRAETISLTAKSFIDGIKEFCEQNETAPRVILKEIDGHTAEKKVIPLIKLSRRKTGKPYYTVISPEATQFIIDFIKTDLSVLDDLDKKDKNKESLFGIKRSTLSSQFQRVNLKHSWGKRGRNNFFSSHRLRHNHYTQINNPNLANALEGRVIRDAIMKSYDHNLDDPEYLREQYKDHMYKFEIFDHYDVNLRDEEVKKLQAENENLRKQLEQTNKNVEDLGKMIDSQRTNIPSHKIHKEILAYLKEIDEMDTNRASLLNLMVFDYVKKNPTEFKDDSEYLRDLIRKLDIQIEMSSKDIIVQHVELAGSRNYDEIDPMFIVLLDDLLNRVKDNEGVMKRVGYIDINKWDYVAEEYLIKKGIVKDIGNYEKLNLSDDEWNELTGEILIRYLETE